MGGPILFPYDGSSLAEHALPCAVRLARATSAPLVLIRAVTGGPAEVLDAERTTQALAQRLRSAQVSVIVRVRAGDVQQILEEECLTWTPEWLVLSTHGQSGLGRWLYGRVAEAMLQQASLPILLVPATCEHALPAERAPRLLVPLDGSADSERALPVARRLAQQLGATVVLLHVVEPPLPQTYAYGQGAPYVEFEPHVELGRARAYLDRAAEALRLPDERVECHAIVGLPSSAIPQVAREHRADLVVLTRRGAGGTSRTLGSAATGTLQLANVPLVLVPTHGVPRRRRPPPSTVATTHESAAGAAAPGAALEDAPDTGEWAAIDAPSTSATPEREVVHAR